MCILFIKKNVVLSGSFLASIENCKSLLNLPRRNKEQSVIFKTFLTYCDLTDKPSDPANDDNFLTQISNLNYSMDALTTTQSKKLRDIYSAYHLSETSDYTQKINQLVNVELEQVLPICMNSKWTTKIMKKYPWVETCAEVVRGEIFDMILEVVNKG